MGYVGNLIIFNLYKNCEVDCVWNIKMQRFFLLDSNTVRCLRPGPSVCMCVRGPSETLQPGHVRQCVVASVCRATAGHSSKAEARQRRICRVAMQMVYEYCCSYQRIGFSNKIG